MWKKRVRDLFWNKPFHPFMIVTFASLALLTANLGQVNPLIFWRPFVLSLLLIGILFGIFRSLFKDNHLAGWLTSIWAIALFTYGHIYNLTDGWTISGVIIGRHRYLVILWLVMFGYFSFLAIKSKRSWINTTFAANMITLILVCVPLVQFLYFEVGIIQFAGKNTDQQSQTTAPRSADLPDVYYIILDAYGRADTLKESFGYDNSTFLDFLSDKGFYIARCSQSNYSHTLLSLSSSLNMSYYDELPIQEYNRLGALIKRSNVKAELEKFGYKTIAFETGFNFTELDHADYYYKSSDFTNLGSIFYQSITSYEILFLRTTIAAAPIDAFSKEADKLKGDEKRKLTLNIYKRLSDIPSIKGPKFVFVHLNTTHPPFVFGKNGEPVETAFNPVRATYNSKEYTEGYRDSLQYSDDQMKIVVENLLKKSEVPPIIIIQGDHGPQKAGSASRMEILNAIYLPKGSNLLYPDITPVNSFRIVMNTYFGGNYPLLDDLSYTSKFGDETNFQLVANTCRP